MAFVVEIMSIRPRGGCEFKFVPRPEEASNEVYLEHGRRYGHELGETVLRGADISLLAIETDDSRNQLPMIEIPHFITGRVISAERI